MSSRTLPRLTLLKTGQFPATDELTAGRWFRLNGVNCSKPLLPDHPDAGWEAWLHFGIMRLHIGDCAGARSAWEASPEQRRTLWTLRNLAVLARQDQQWDQARNTISKRSVCAQICCRCSSRPRAP
ncbi:MAG: tetratricopeptide repeat protein [Chloroflexi bacterium]|uniref:tetratricopeptide repeat protein n=1 Tax=Candidatus Flexifilum breve TaxID=3140694 RepID=UPI003136F237|nr:tetratricopeptide repeat protein [Chloroflexota bacterium]